MKCKTCGDNHVTDTFCSRCFAKMLRSHLNAKHEQQGLRKQLVDLLAALHKLNPEHWRMLAVYLDGLKNSDKKELRKFVDCRSVGDISDACRDIWAAMTLNRDYPMRMSDISTRCTYCGHQTKRAIMKGVERVICPLCHHSDELTPEREKACMSKGD